MKALHVIAPPAPTLASDERNTAAACALLAAHLRSAAHARVIVLGPRSAERSLSALGVRTDRAMLPRRGIARTSVRSLRGELAAAAEVHAWGTPAIEAVLAARPQATVIAHADDAPPDGHSGLKRLDRVETYDQTDAEQWANAIGTPERVCLTDTIAPPPLDSRPALRSALGIHNDAVVVAGLWDPASTFDARRFVFRIGFLELLERPTVAIIPAQARRVAAARRFRSAASLRFRLLITPAPVTAFFPACDALAPLDPEPGMPTPARGAVRVLTEIARATGVPVAEPARSPEPGVVSREMAEFMAPLIERIDAARAEGTPA